MATCALALSVLQLFDGEFDFERVLLLENFTQEYKANYTLIVEKHEVDLDL